MEARWATEHPTHTGQSLLPPTKSDLAQNVNRAQWKYLALLHVLWVLPPVFQTCSIQLPRPNALPWASITPRIVTQQAPNSYSPHLILFLPWKEMSSPTYKLPPIFKVQLSLVLTTLRSLPSGLVPLLPLPVSALGQLSTDAPLLNVSPSKPQVTWEGTLVFSLHEQQHLTQLN